MQPGALNRIVDTIVSMFGRPNPTVAAVIVEDMGLVNGTQHVIVDLRGEDRLAMYLPALAVEAPGNCWVERLSSADDSPLAVVLTNYQVNFRGGWGSGEQDYTPPTTGPGSGYDAGTGLGRPATTSHNQYGWGDQPWGR